MRKISESLFSRFPRTTNAEDLELYDLVAFEHPRGYLVVARFFGCEDNVLTFHNLKLSTDDIKEYYILASPLRKKKLDKIEEKHSDDS